MILVCPVRAQDKATGRIAGAAIVGVHVGLITPLTGEFRRMRSGRNRLASRQDPGELNRLPVDCKSKHVAAQRKRKLQGPIRGGQNEYVALDRVAAAVAVVDHRSIRSKADGACGRAPLTNDAADARGCTWLGWRGR